GPTQAADYPGRAGPTDPSAGQLDDLTRPASSAAARTDPHHAAGPDRAGIEPRQPRRPWWRRPVPIAGIAVLALLLAAAVTSWPAAGTRRPAATRPAATAARLAPQAGPRPRCPCRRAVRRRPRRPASRSPPR